jgi:hypothetical protein
MAMRVLIDFSVPEARAGDRHLRGPRVVEDFAMGESIQRGRSSDANQEVLFDAFEHALTHFHTQIEQLDRTHTITVRPAYDSQAIARRHETASSLTS